MSCANLYRMRAIRMCSVGTSFILLSRRYRFARNHFDLRYKTVVDDNDGIGRCRTSAGRGAVRHGSN